MNQAKIDRINELARKSHTSDGLTEAEKQEQAILRQEYRNGFVNNLTQQLENVTIVEPDGTKHKVTKSE